MGHELVALLGRRVERDRRVHVVVLAERHLLVAAVDARRRGIHEMLDRVVPAGLQYVEEAHEVTVHIGLRVLYRVAHAGLRGQVHHDVEAVLGEDPLHQGRVGEVTPHEGEAAIGIRLPQHREACLLDARVVVAVHVVQADDDVVGRLKQPLYQERAYETCRAGNQYLFTHINS